MHARTHTHTHTNYGKDKQGISCLVALLSYVLVTPETRTKHLLCLPNRSHFSQQNGFQRHPTGILFFSFLCLVFSNGLKQKNWLQWLKVTEHRPNQCLKVIEAKENTILRRNQGDAQSNFLIRFITLASDLRHNWAVFPMNRRDEIKEEDVWIRRMLLSSVAVGQLRQVQAGCWQKYFQTILSKANAQMFFCCCFFLEFNKL